MTLRLFLALALLPAFASARTLHVNAASGDDARDGTSPASAVRTLQRAAGLARAGDEVVVGPGVYFEQVTLPSTARGEPGRPVIFRADRIQRDRVVLTGAARAIRENRTPWALVDDKLGLYAVAFSGSTPARVTYDHVDLFPYGSLEELKTFTTAWDGGSPGPRHGFYHDTSTDRLYVRLHASGRYGAPDPNLHVMAVSPRRSSGRAFSIPGKGPAHVVIEGITFETPGDSAIYTEADAVTVRDCWFFGAPYAVRGTHTGQTTGAGASDIVIEHCEVAEFSTYDDATELLRAAGIKPGERAPWSAIWHRKTTGRYGLPSGTKNYENGIAVRMGSGWIIRHNYIHDIFEGLANDGMSNATDVRIHDNIFARICDNAIETENHARDVHIYRNLFLDVFEPFSYQPHDGPPWPGPIYFYQNVVANTPELAEVWRPAPHSRRGLFKLGISLKNWSDGRNAGVPRSSLAAPAPGLLFFNNSLYFPGGRFLTLMGSRDVPIANVQFAHNLIATDHVLSLQPGYDLPSGFFSFRNNLTASATPGEPGPGELLAGEDGRAYPSVDALGWTDPSAHDFHLRADSPALDRGGAVTGSPVPVFKDIGAIQATDTWFPPRVGPREN